VGFVVDKVALGQVFSEYFGSPANLHSTNFSTITITYHPGLVQQASKWPQYPKSHPMNLKKKLRAGKGGDNVKRIINYCQWGSPIKCISYWKS
jgi:hypothetical protein